MKQLIAILLALTIAPIASACSYGAGFASAYSAGYQVYNNFQVVAPVQAQLYVAPLVTYSYQAPVAYSAPVTVQQYAYQSPLLSITYGQPLANVVQYQLPLAAPVQPYYSNYSSSAVTCPNCAQSLYR